MHCERGGCELNVSAGEYLGGQRQGIELEIFWKPNPQWAARVSAGNDWQQLPRGNFETFVVNGAVQWTPTTDLLLTTDLKYDNLSEKI